MIFILDIILPDDVASEKAQILEKLGAKVQKGKQPTRHGNRTSWANSVFTVRPVSIVSRQHYVNLARHRAESFGGIEIVGPDGKQRRDDLVVTTRADRDEVYHQNQDKRQMWDSFEDQPRGFFADQFEVESLTGPHVFEADA